MRINTQEAIDAAKAARDRYGTWSNAKEAGKDNNKAGPSPQGDTFKR